MSEYIYIYAEYANVKYTETVQIQMIIQYTVCKNCGDDVLSP